MKAMCFLCEHYLQNLKRNIHVFQLSSNRQKKSQFILWPSYYYDMGCPFYNFLRENRLNVQPYFFLLYPVLKVLGKQYLLSLYSKVNVTICLLIRVLETKYIKAT